jgi:hypothetical protein
MSPEEMEKEALNLEKRATAIRSYAYFIGDIEVYDKAMSQWRSLINEASDLRERAKRYPTSRVSASEIPDPASSADRISA